MKLKIKSSLGSQIAERNAKSKSSKKSRRFAQRAINKKIRTQNKRVCAKNARCANDELGHFDIEKFKFNGYYWA